jgi:hypothetical protein
MAIFPTDVAARQQRATLSRAVDHVPDALLYKSTSLEYPYTAVSLIRCNLLQSKREQTNGATSQTHTLHAQQLQHKQKPYTKHRKAAITSDTAREEGHVPNRCRCKIRAPHTKPSSRPGARFTVVKVHNIGTSIICVSCLPPREDGHVANRRRCKTIARHTEPSSRPNALRC